jgi:hypothetical protein
MVEKIKAERSSDITLEFEQILQKMLVVKENRANAIQLYSDSIIQYWIKQRGMILFIFVRSIRLSIRITV